VGLVEDHAHPTELRQERAPPLRQLRILVAQVRWVAAWSHSFVVLVPVHTYRKN
jgi:hypothetical protein